MNDAASATECREVFFSGRVQGVGFRYTVRNIALRHPVRGFVRNLHDGRVQLVAEGEADALEHFLAAIEAEMKGYIAGRHATVRPATGEFAGFEVRR